MPLAAGQATIQAMSDKVKRRLTTVLCADVHGYSRLMETDEAGTLARLKTVRLEVIDPAIARHGRSKQPGGALQRRRCRRNRWA